MDTLNAVKNIIINELGFAIKNMKLNSSFRDDLGMDSLDLVELTVLAENQFNIEIEDDAAVHLNTIQHLVSFINHKTNHKS
jgi:acyl carrier protein